MSPDKEKYLIETYPKFFKIRDAESNENHDGPKSCITLFGFEHEDGWFDLVERLMKNIYKIFLGYII